MLTRTVFLPEPLMRMNGDMARLFDSLAATTERVSRAAAATAPRPPLNIWHSENELHVEAELPGVRLEDLEIVVESGALTIRGRRPELSPPTEAQTLRNERPSGEFFRAVTLPSGLDASRAKATLADGVLTISIPRDERTLPRRVVVSAAQPHAAGPHAEQPAADSES